MSKIIIDANVASEFSDKTTEAREIFRWLLTKGYLAIGGKNLEELVKTDIRKMIEELSRSGRIARISDLSINSAATELSNKHLKSNDIHIIALALAGNARLLYSRDINLITDFTNSDILRPKGKCYQKHNVHRHLLT